VSTDGRLGPVTVLIGGVGELYQGDLDFGRRVVERLADDELGTHVAVEDLHYGGVAVAQRIEELGVTTLVLVGATERGRSPGVLERRRYFGDRLGLTPEELQGAVTDAVTGYVTIDLVVEVAHALGVLPSRVVAIDVEPVVRNGPDDALSAAVAGVIDEAVELARDEARRAALFLSADQLRDTVADGHLTPSPALDALRSLLDEIQALDEQGRWGATFACRDRLEVLLGAGETPEGMTRLDTGLWWNVIEEIDRLQKNGSVLE
jgi:Ni,Fe-hydrogenase maturation factor